MAKHTYHRVVKRVDTPGPAYHIMEQQGHTPHYKTVAKSTNRIKANMSAGIRDSERTREERNRNRRNDQ